MKQQSRFQSLTDGAQESCLSDSRSCAVCPLLHTCEAELCATPYLTIPNSRTILYVFCLIT